MIPTLYILTREAAEYVPAALGGRFVREESEGAHSASCVPTASISKSPNPHHHLSCRRPAAGLYRAKQATAVGYAIALIRINRSEELANKWAANGGIKGLPIDPKSLHIIWQP